MAGKIAMARPGPAYTAAKAGVIALAASLNASEQKYGIRACSVCPGEVNTPAMSRRAQPLTEEALNSMLTPEDVASAIEFVVSLPARVCINELSISPLRRPAASSA